MENFIFCAVYFYEYPILKLLLFLLKLCYLPNFSENCVRAVTGTFDDQRH